MIAMSKSGVPFPSVFEKIHTLAIIENYIGNDGNWAFKDLHSQLSLSPDGLPNWLPILTGLKTLLLIKDYDGVTLRNTGYPWSLVEFTNRDDQVSPNLVPLE